MLLNSVKKLKLRHWLLFVLLVLILVFTLEIITFNSHASEQPTQVKVEKVGD